MYHHVTAEAGPFLPNIATGDFIRQLGYLRRNYRIAGLDDLIDGLKNGKPIPPRSLALTFDDEYDDIYRNAFPHLKRFGLPATVFIATGFVDTDDVPWTDELGFLFKETNVSAVELKSESCRKDFAWSDPASKLKAFKDLKGALKALPEAERAGVYARIKEQLAVKRANPARILSGDQIREMAAAGIGFGAHTVHHAILTRVAPAVAGEEIVGSKKQLEGILGREVKGFCYPNGELGDFNEAIKAMVRGAGFGYACTTLEGAVAPGADRYELRRSWTSEPLLPLFAARLLKT